MTITKAQTQALAMQCAIWAAALGVQFIAGHWGHVSFWRCLVAIYVFRIITFRRALHDPESMP